MSCSSARDWDSQASYPSTVTLRMISWYYLALSASQIMMFLSRNITMTMRLLINVFSICVLQFSSYNVWIWFLPIFSCPSNNWRLFDTSFLLHLKHYSSIVILPFRKIFFCYTAHLCAICAIYWRYLHLIAYTLIINRMAWTTLSKHGTWMTPPRRKTRGFRTAGSLMFQFLLQNYLVLQMHVFFL